jgi:hypothetical protein
MALTTQLIGQKAADEWRPEKYRNHYVDAVRELIKEKAKGHTIVTAEEPAAPRGTVINLMDALKKSIQSGKPEPTKAPAAKRAQSVDQLPDAKPSTHEREDVSSAKGDSLSPFNRERVTLTPLKGDTVSPDPSLPVNVPYGENSSASDEAGAEAQIWKEGLVLLQSTSLPEAQCRKLIGRWCKRAPSEENKQRLLGILRAARRAGTGDPVPYVTRALSEALPPPADPKTFTTDAWRIKLQAAINTKQWSPAWGPPPWKRGCLVPAALLAPELKRALSAAAPQRTARAQTVHSPVNGELRLHGNG